jgi:hypothetical protein
MDNDDVTVLLVWNGPGVPDSWQLPQIIKKLRLQGGDSGEGRVEELEEANGNGTSSG